MPADDRIEITQPEIEALDRRREEAEKAESKPKQEAKPKPKGRPPSGRQVKTVSDYRFANFVIAMSLLTAFWLYDTGRLNWLKAIWTSSPNAYASPGEIAMAPVHHCDFWCSLGNVFQQAAQDYAASQGIPT